MTLLKDAEIPDNWTLPLDCTQEGERTKFNERLQNFRILFFKVHVFRKSTSRLKLLADSSGEIWTQCT